MNIDPELAWFLSLSESDQVAVEIGVLPGFFDRPGAHEMYEAWQQAEIARIYLDHLKRAA